VVCIAWFPCVGAAVAPLVTPACSAGWVSSVSVAGCKQLDQELDLEFYHHKFAHGKQWYLGVQRGKHRGHMIQDEKKFFILPFPSNLMPIPDDINDDGPIIRRIGASTQTNKEDEDLTMI
jgi:hypothetical protein